MDAAPYPSPCLDIVAWRAISLHALVIRAEFEYAHMLTPDPEAPELLALPARLKALADWVREQGLKRHFSEREQALFSRPLGAWSEPDVLAVSWRKESLGVLLWALSSLDELPPYDEEFPDQSHLDCIGWLQPAAEFLQAAVLRPLVELEGARHAAELWHWRARASRLQRAQPRLAKRYSLPQIIREAALRAHAEGYLPTPIAGDFPALSKAYARLREQDLALVQAISRERLFALSWLCGYVSDSEETGQA